MRIRDVVTAHIHWCKCRDTRAPVCACLRMAIGDQQPVLAPVTADSARPREAADRLPHHPDPLLACAQALLAAATQPDLSAVVTCLAGRVLEVLNADLVCVLRQRADRFVVEAMAATDPSLSVAVQDACALNRFFFVEDLAARAHACGDAIAVPIGAYDPPSDLVPAPGHMLAAPLSSNEMVGGLVVYRCGVRPFDVGERSLLAGLASLGALAIANAELHARAHSRGHELQQLLDITADLAGATHLQDFLHRFVVRAAEFLGFRRSFIAVCPGSSAPGSPARADSARDGVVDEHGCEIRCLAEEGVARPLAVPLPESLALRLHGSPEPFWSNDIRQWPAVELAGLAGLDTRQVLCVPLLGVASDESAQVSASETHAPHPAPRLLGVLGLIDRIDAADITSEDVRRARSLAAEVSVALQAARGLHDSTQVAAATRRSEILMDVALELNSTLHLADFGESFTRHAVETFGCLAAALAVVRRDGEERLEVVDIHDRSRTYDPATRHSLGAMLTDIVYAHGATPGDTTAPRLIVRGPAAVLLGANAAAALGWNDITVARMSAPDGTLIGCLVLVDVAHRATPERPASRALRPASSSDDEALLTTLAAHGAVALENARLFTRMDQANRHWMEIFDAITDLIVVHDQNLKVLRVNRSLADFIGVSPNELIGVSMRAMIAMAADHTSEACPFCRVVSGGDEYIHPVLDRTYLVSTSRVHGAASEGMQTIHVLKDITDRREAERRYRELFDTIQEGLFFSTPEGRFIEVNEALVRMLGYESREDLLSVDITREIYVSPDEREDFRREIHEHGMVRNYQEILRRRDGSLIYTLQNAFAVRDGHGQVVQYRGLILDITELKTFQGELQRQRDFNTKILDNTQSMIMVVDTAGLISYGNRRCFETGGYTQDELLGRRLVDLVPTPRRSTLDSSLAETLAGDQVDNLELPILLGQGRSGQFSINLSPMRDESGNVNSIVAVMTDISDAAMLQAKLMHTEKMAAVGQLVSGVAHEVNNPLTAVLGFTDLLIENPEVPESAKNDLRVVLQEAQRTKQIVQNLLSFARQMPPERHSVQVNLVVRRTLALRSYDFANHGIQIIERLEDSIPEIMADAHQLQQVFLNILNNAYDAVQGNNRPGRIEISTSASSGWSEVIFRDNGHGISYPERIFDPFFTTKEVGKGTGLGLSICYGIVREHGGEILCRNNGDAPGATFTVRLPIGEGRVARAAAGGHD